MQPQYQQDNWGAPQGGPQGPGGWGQPGQQQGFGGPQHQQHQWTPSAPLPGTSAPRPAVTPPDPDELMQGGYKAASFPDQQYGHTVGGPIVEKPITTQQLDFDSRAPKFYDDGNPMWQVIVAVQAQQPTDDDDGIRAFYLRSQMKKAAQEAVRRSGARRLEVGGELWVRYVRDEPNSRGRGKDKKIYEAKYTPPGEAQPAAQPAVAQPGPIPGLANHASSPVLKKQGITPATAFDSEPPF